MRNWILISLISVIFVSAIFGAFYLYQKRVAESELTPPPLPTPDESFQSLQENNQANSEVLGTQPQTGGSDQMKESGITVSSPQVNSTVSTPLAVSGWTKIANSQITIRIKGQDGSVLRETTTSTCTNFEVCSFDTTLFFDKPTAQTGTLEVYSPSQNSEEYLTTTVVQFD